ncbi:MAG: hypothetical protein ACR2QO_03145 [Acidimicrobiales bacterium]
MNQRTLADQGEPEFDRQSTLQDLVDLLGDGGVHVEDPTYLSDTGEIYLCFPKAEHLLVMLDAVAPGPQSTWGFHCKPYVATTETAAAREWQLMVGTRIPENEIRGLKDALRTAAM